MADDKTFGVQNKWLLLISVSLGLIVVIIYNMHIKKIKEDARQTFVSVVRLKKDVESGSRITSRELERFEMPAANEAILKNLVQWEHRSGVTQGVPGGRMAVKKLKRGDFLTWDAVGISEGKFKSASDTIQTGHCIFAVKIDRDHSPGDTLTLHDRVELAGIPLEGSEVVPIIRGVEVVNIGGRGGTPGAGSAARSYDQIGIKVSRPVRDLLQNIELYLKEGFWVSVLPSKEHFTPDSTQQISQLRAIKDKLAKGDIKGLKTLRRSSR